MGLTGKEEQLVISCRTQQGTKCLDSFIELKKGKETSWTQMKRRKSNVTGIKSKLVQQPQEPVDLFYSYDNKKVRNFQQYIK